MVNTKEKLIECVPNFSEGRDRKKIEEIIKVIENTDKIKVLSVDIGYSVNRSVITFIGPAQNVEDAAYCAIKKAAQVIDMNQHKGAHPRIGATDVCPFIPLKNAIMEDCIEISERLGKRVGEQLQIPVYLYEHSAKKDECKNLPDIRRGGYENLEYKLKQDEWEPDYGPRKLINNAGATVIGARRFLIAFNINLASRELIHARLIAEQIRETGGHATKGKPGLFKNCRAIGWFIPEYNCCQVSVNLTNYLISSPHMVYEAVKNLAAKMKIRVTGSELIGLIPEDALVLAGDFYMKKQGNIKKSEHKRKLQYAAERLGLNKLHLFEMENRVLHNSYL
jgi:glutamate formiminotransferase/formiminotetrahydrofolate cyclodeaminase